MHCERLRIRPHHSWRKVSGDAPLRAPLRREDAVSRLKSQTPGSSRSEEIRNSIKEWLQCGESDLPDKIKNLLQNRVHPSPRFGFVSRKILERYESGDLSLHFHITEYVGDSGAGKIDDEVSQRSVVGQLFSGGLHLNDSASSALQSNRSVLCKQGHNVYGSVFVDVVKVVQGSEYLIPSMVRLQSLDDCLRLCGNTIQPVRFEFIRKIDVGTANREMVTRCICLSSKLIDSVVEGRTGVVQKIPDDSGQVWIDRGEFQPNCAFIRILILLENDLALFGHKAVDGLEYNIQMLLCPDQFEQGAI